MKVFVIFSANFKSHNILDKFIFENKEILSDNIIYIFNLLTSNNRYNDNHVGLDKSLYNKLIEYGINCDKKIIKHDKNKKFYPNDLISYLYRYLNICDIVYFFVDSYNISYYDEITIKTLNKFKDKKINVIC